jgi:two-component system chemotaxis response regulator CheB
MTILVAEDDPASARILEVTLRRCAHAVTLVRNGREALDALGKGPFDAVVTDWMMPELDGIELVRTIRRLPKPHPILLVLTSLRSDEARLHALQSGADEFLCKPLRPVELLERLNSGLARRQSTLVIPAPAPASPSIPTALPPVTSAPPAPVRVSAAPVPERPVRVREGTAPGAMAPFSVVGIAASTGGPLALKAFVEARALSRRTAYLIVLHGPDWVQRHMVTSLASVTDLPVAIAVQGETIEPGKVYLSPGDRHLCVAEGGRKIEIRNTPEINYVRPSADPLFQTLAEGFVGCTDDL